LVALAALELLLRLFGYGASTSLFLKSRVAGHDVWIDNPQFARRFFPPDLARAPEPLMMPAAKAQDTLRIFILGESAAMGDPEPAYGFPRILEVLLRDAMPGRKVEVLNVAVTAINSHAIRGIARDCADKQGDWWIVYMGNNEVVGPFGAGTVFSRQAPSLGVLRSSLALKSTRVGQLLDALQWRLTSRRPKSWEGMEMFLEQQVAHDDPRMAKVYEHFERNLRDILDIGHRSGARLLVSTVAGNLKDCPPFASKQDTNTQAGAREEWLRRVESGNRAEQEKRHAEALKLFEGTAKFFPGSAELNFRIGRCLAALGQHEQARRHFEQARDLDTLRFRADSKINETIHRVSTNEPAIKFLDAVDLIARHSTNGIAGEELLQDHVHFNFVGNFLIARAFAEQILGPTNQPAFLTLDDCARRLAFTDYERARVLEEMLKRVQQPPFTTQLDAAAREARWREQTAVLQALQRPDTFAATAAVYRDAIARAPGDWVLREHFGRFLGDAGDFKAAEEQWRRVTELIPHRAEGYFSLANALDAQGRSGEAIRYFREALRRRSGSVDVRNGLGLALASSGDANAAIGEFEAALRLKPDFSEARVNLGQTLAQQGRLNEALAQYAEALRVNSNCVAAHINLGKLLAGQGKHAGAATHYREALRIKPDHAIAHFNLGNALIALGDPHGAEHFAAAVKSNPDFSEAHYSLALALARQDRAADALAHFAAAARLKPDFAEGRFNYGVALAKAARFDEATREFEETLRLDPSNDRARKFLEQAQARVRK
jgi:tetratricopeptide (TPR) repeat protein